MPKFAEEELARYLKKRKRRWYFVMEIPAQHRSRFGGKARIEKTLNTRDEGLAAAKAQKLAGEYKLKFLAWEGNPHAEDAVAQQEYEQAALEVQRGELLAFATEDVDPVEFAVDLEIDRILDTAPIPARPDDERGPELTPAQEARIAGLVDGLARWWGEAPPNRERFEPKFDELAQRWLEAWKASPDRRETNTGSQYAAAIRLFAEFWGKRTIREVRQHDAAEFIELLRRLPADHGRGKWKGVPLREAVELGGDIGKGLSSASMKRHLGVLKQIWKWAKQLGYCTGENPFMVEVPKQKKRPYLAWQTGDLQQLFGSPPRRRDIYEAFMIAMFTGFRVSEVADLTWGQVRTEEGVPFIQVEDAKTDAGVREVPLHSSIMWLLDKERGADADPVFPTFTPEGPGKRRGGDASKLFGAWKRRLGFTSRRHVFHSARKNVTRIMEEHGIPSNQWARIIGHEPGFTFGTYNPHGLTLAKKHEIIELIRYPDVPMRPPAEIYGDQQKLSRAK